MSQFSFSLEVPWYQGNLDSGFRKLASVPLVIMREDTPQSVLVLLILFSFEVSSGVVTM